MSEHTDRLNKEIHTLQSILESTANPIFAFDRELNYIAFNNAHKEAVKKAGGPEIKLGDNYIDLVKKVSSGNFDKILGILRLALNGTAVETIEEIREESAHRRYFRVLCNPIYDAKAIVTGISIFCYDISEKILLQKELEEQSQILNGLRQNLPIMIYEIAADGMIVRCAGAALRAIGLTEDELTGRIAFEVYPEIADDLSRVLLSDKPGLFTTPLSINGKKLFYQNFTFPHPYIKGSIIGFALDITRQKEIEAKLRHAKVIAEEVADAKHQFLSNMSHEIRTPMNAVIGMAHLLMTEDHSPEQEEKLKTLKFSADMLLSLLNDILDYSKIESGKVVFEEIVFNLAELVNSIYHAHRFYAEEKDLQFRITFDPELPEAIVGDPVRLTQILNNLISNALKFTQTGLVSIDIRLNTMDDNQVLIDFSVKDTGIGIDPSLIEVIFENFTQARTDTTRRFGGTGLGLAITKKLLQLQESDIHVTSEPGKGSEFFFRLAFKKASVTQIRNFKTAVSNYESLAGHNVLIVDDNNINIAVASKFLKKWDMEIDSAGSGLEAVEKVKKQNYDVILMDLQMPEMDGYTAAKAIRALIGKRFQEVPVIALTASALPEIREKVMEAGMNDHISKPFNPAELYAKIVNYLDQKKETL